MASKPISSAPAKSSQTTSPQPSAVEERSGTVPPAPAPPRVRFKNRMTQLLALHLTDADGRLHHVEIPAQGSVDWPRFARLADYGVDVGIKIRNKYLSIEPVK